MKKQKQFLAIVVLCLTTLSAWGQPTDSPRDRGPRLRERIIRIIRVVTTGDGLTPPFPAPKP